MSETKELFADSADSTMTGYTLSICGTINTGQIGMGPILPIQGLITFIAPPDKQEDFIFPNLREDRFLDKGLEEFYKKKGYGKHLPA